MKSLLADYSIALSAVAIVSGAVFTILSCIGRDDRVAVLGRRAWQILGLALFVSLAAITGSFAGIGFASDRDCDYIIAYYANLRVGSAETLVGLIGDLPDPKLQEEKAELLRLLRTLREDNQQAQIRLKRWGENWAPKDSWVGKLIHGS